MRRACDPAPDSGFTLLEMIVVLVVLALAGSIVLARGPSRSSTLDLRACASTIATMMRAARAAAIASDADRTFTIDLAARDYGIRGGARTTLPAAVEIEGVPRPVLFHPDGSASGGAVTLAEDGRRVTIRVDWLTGLVAVALP